MSNHPYRDHVNQTLVSLSNIKRKVWVLFAIDDSDNNKDWFRGEIKKVRMQLNENDGSVGIEHFIHFDDGEEYWFSLDEKEDMDHLRWDDPTIAAAAAAAPPNMVPVKQEAEQEESAPASASLPVVSHGERRVQQPHQNPAKGTGVVTKNTGDGGTCDEDTSSKKRPHYGTIRLGNNQVQEDESLTSSESHTNEPKKEPSNKKSRVGEEGDDDDEKEKARHFNSLKGSIKKWVRTLGLTKAYGTEQEGLDIITSNADKYVMPDSFEQVFLLTDFLFPGKEYHSTLFESQSRPGKPVRDVLRDLKKEDPSDPLVSWHQKCGKWNPPTASVCVGMVMLIEDML